MVVHTFSTTNDHFTKTGSGTNIGKVEKERGVFWICVAEPAHKHPLGRAFGESSSLAPRYGKKNRFSVPFPAFKNSSFLPRRAQDKHRLPGQARDKHGESTQKKTTVTVVLGGRALGARLD
jgi:hypothetical protein